MPSDAPELIIELNDPQLDGLSAPGRVQPLDPFHWKRDSVAKRRVRIQKDGRDVDLTGCTLASAVGIPDQASTSGTFSVTYGANTASGIAYNANAATVQAALVALGSIGVGGVVVDMVGTLYRVRWTANGARTDLIIDGSLLLPPITPWRLETTTGDGSTKEVQLFSITQTPLAYSDDWTLHQGGTATSTQNFAGDFSAPARYTITFDPAPEGGVLVMSCAVKEVTQVVFSGTTGGEADTEGCWFTLCDQFGVVGFWFSDGTRTSPPDDLLAVTTRMLQKISVVTGDTTSQVNDAIETQLLFFAASFTVTSTPSDVPIIVENVEDGERTSPRVDSTGLMAATVQALGFSATAPINIGANAGEISAALGGDFNVNVGEDNTLTLVATSNRALPNFTLDYSSVTFPDYFEGTMSFDQEALEFGVAALTASQKFLECITEFYLTRPAAPPECILEYPSWVYKNLLRRDSNYNQSGVSGQPVVTGNTLWVDEIYGTASGVVNRQDRPYATIQLAVDAMSPGDLIFVRSGTYAGNVSLLEGVKIRGASRDSVIISGDIDDTTGGISSAIIEGVTITGEVALTSPTGIRFADCAIDDISASDTSSSVSLDRCEIADSELLGASDSSYTHFSEAVNINTGAAPIMRFCTFAGAASESISSPGAINIRAHGCWARLAMNANVTNLVTAGIVVESDVR